MVIPIVEQMTALEVAKRSSNPDSFVILETMAMSNTMLQELPVKEANDGAVHTTLKRLSYPGGERRIYNRGVGKSVSKTEPVKDIITMLETLCDVDEDLAKHGGNPEALYKSEGMAHLIGMGIDQADALIYDKPSNEGEIFGFATRYPKVNTTNCIDFGGTGNNLTSLYIIAAGPNTCHLIYPKGSKSVGVERLNQGVIYVKDAEGKEYLAHRDHYKAQFGLSVPHPDAVVRICNIPLNLDQNGRKKLIEYVLRFEKNLPLGIVNNVLFCNKDLVFQVEQAGREAQYVLHPETDPWGKPVTSINGIRIRRQDAILSTEGQVA